MNVKLVNVKKVYDRNGIAVVKDFSLEIADKEFLVLVGPSGCGKSTALRMIAGLETITQGELYFDGKVMNDVLPGDRNIAMVFQNYALYPHLTVFQNMEYPLKIKKIPATIRREKILSVAEMLGIEEYLKRKPKQLSGGQRQRVALGRELVRDVDLFLMDEPLSNLDAKLRVQMRGEITKLHQNIQKTFIYVTHDQIEAMTMASRIVIMKDGVIQQVGTPKEVYEKPSNTFVAGFIGTPAMNFIKGIVDEKGYFMTKDFRIQLPTDKLKIIKNNDCLDKEIILGIRPEDITVQESLVSEEKLPQSEVLIDIAELLGFEYNLIFKINDSNVIARTKATKLIFSGERVNLHFDLTKCHVFNCENEKVLV